MNDPELSRIGRNIDFAFKLVLVALVTLRVLFPPQPSQPMAHDKMVHSVLESGTVQ